MAETLAASIPRGKHAKRRRTRNREGARAGRPANRPNCKPARAEVGTTAQERASPKHLTRELAKAKLPGEVAKHLKTLIGAREIVDSHGLAKHGNKRTAEWVVENRVGRWYVEALKDKGVKRMAAAGRNGFRSRLPVERCRQVHCRQPGTQELP